MDLSKNNFKKVVWDLLENPESKRNSAKWIRRALSILIFLNVLAVLLESVQWFEAAYKTALHFFDYFSFFVFLFEYILRCWSCNISLKYIKPNGTRWKYAGTHLAVIDLIALLTFGLSYFEFDLQVVRIIRLTRVIRIAKEMRYIPSLEKFIRVFKSKYKELLLTLLGMFIVIILAATLMFISEHPTQPDKFPHILAAMWWAIVKLTSLVHGDVYPVTIIGKSIAVIFSILCIGLTSIFTSIIVSGFVEEFHNISKQTSKLSCPHCKREIDLKELDIKQITISN
jgi:voltage-gated potassium channel